MCDTYHVYVDFEFYGISYNESTVTNFQFISSGKKFDVFIKKNFFLKMSL